MRGRSRHRLEVEQRAPHRRVVGGSIGVEHGAEHAPDTFFVPSDPINVTLISRPDTPRSRRSSAVIVPTFVRLSRPNIVESCVRV